MPTIAYLEADNQELFFWFFLAPDSKKAFITRAGVPYLASKFPWQIKVSSFFDLSQDPPDVNHPAFIDRWPFIDGATLDLNVQKDPSCVRAISNPHGVCNIVAAFSLAGDRWPGIRDDNLVILNPPFSRGPDRTSPGVHPDLKLVPLRPKSIRHDRTPGDLFKYLSRVPSRLPWRHVLKAMYKSSLYLPLSSLEHYVGRSKKKARVYLRGNDHLADMTALSPRTVRRTLTWLKSLHFIHLRKRGYPGEGNSIWELPFTLAHTFAWRRKPRSSKTYLL